MVVVNIAGYHLSVYYNEKEVIIPFDNKVYTVPDDFGTYSELRILVPPAPVKQENVVKVTDDDLKNAKENKKTKKKPLKGIKIKKKKRAKIIKDKRTEWDIKMSKDK